MIGEGSPLPAASPPLVVVVVGVARRGPLDRLLEVAHAAGLELDRGQASRRAGHEKMHGPRAVGVPLRDPLHLGRQVNDVALALGPGLDLLPMHRHARMVASGFV